MIEECQEMMDITFDCCFNVLSSASTLGRMHCRMPKELILSTKTSSAPWMSTMKGFDTRVDSHLALGYQNNARALIVRILTCFARFELSANALPQPASGHLNGFSPE